MTDPFAWLEEVEGEEQLAWARERNSHAEEALATPRFAELRAQILKVEESDARIPEVSKHGEYLYNFWTDKQHERGVWRRTTEAEFEKDDPAWEVLLDLDALGEEEGVNWVWHSADLLPHAFERALVRLSRGGADAHVTREFDLRAREFVAGGFETPEAKGVIGWADTSGDALLAATDFGPGTMTSSGYPRTVRLWRRGENLKDAEVLFSAEESDMGVWAHHDFTGGFERTLIVRRPRFFEADYYLLRGGELVQLEVPRSSIATLHREWLLLELREAWEVGGREHKAGSLLAAELEAFLRGERDLTVLLEPTASTSLAQVVATKHHVALNVLEDVKSRLELRTQRKGGWEATSLDVSGAAASQGEPLTLNVRAVDREHSDDLWVTAQGFLTPPTLARVSIGVTGAARARPLKQLPAFFDTTGLAVVQRFARSRDGTCVPYFMVGKEEHLTGGGDPAPTLLYAYGGFEIPLLPAYSGAVGRGWLERGGLFVVANIRGGGEYGPRWHRAALRDNRHRAYEDLAAVARELVRQGVTVRERLGVRGGSNGGLLVGNMLVSYPELFGAVVCQVPLLDMKRYSHLLAGASWMAEYGDPDDPSDWEFIRTFSPYHLHEKGRDYPPVLFTTSTRDDRVHPAHARKMAARMLAAGDDVTYYENIEGGHGGAATSAQRAYLNALVWEFLWQRVGERPGAD